MIINADARSIPLADESVQTVVTSPPYWGLRDYGVDEMIGLEPAFYDYLDHLVEVFREVRRVLKPDGTLWLNMGDSYAASAKGSGGTGKSTLGAASGGNGISPEGVARSQERQAMQPRRYALVDIKPKDLVGQPWEVAFALRRDGWFLRSDIIWAKPNPMPESVRDRPTKAHEYVFLLSKSPRYYFDADAVRRPLNAATVQRDLTPRGRSQNGGGSAESVAGYDYSREGLGDMQSNQLGANIRTVWTIPTQPFSEAHFATFPNALVIPCIKAGSAEGDVVLDPFAGSGTTGVVARKLVRRFVGLELNPDYCQMAEHRIAKECPPNLFDEVPA